MPTHRNSSHSHAAETLRRPVRPAVIGRYVGQLLVVVAALVCVPLVVALRFGEVEMALRFAAVAATLGAAGGVLARLPAPRHLHRNEAMVVAALLFVGTPFVTAVPLTAGGLGYLDALFEAVSGITTTGLSTLPSVEDRPRAFLFARAWMQWYGGLGIVVLSVALVMRPGPLTRGLAAAEGPDDDLVGGARAHARRALGVYALLTAGGAAALWLLGAGDFDAIVYSLAAVSTGGFAPHDDSLVGLGGLGPAVLVTLLCVAGSVSMTFYRRLPRRGLREALHDTQLRMLLLLGAGISAALFATLVGVSGSDAGTALHDAPLLAFSAQTTAGFAATDVGALDPASKLLLCVSMAIGGGAGSTAGGIKLLRILVLVRLLHAFVRRTGLPPHAVYEPRVGGHVITRDDARSSLVVLGLFVGTVLVSWLAFVAAGHDGIDSLFEVVSATGTVGLSSGITAPDLAAPLKIVLCVDMWLGRLELIPVVVLLYPGTWFGGNRRNAA